MSYHRTKLTHRRGGLGLLFTTALVMDALSILALGAIIFLFAPDGLRKKESPRTASPVHLPIFLSTAPTGTPQPAPSPSSKSPPAP